jgi:hypothetical protein
MNTSKNSYAESSRTSDKNTSQKRHRREVMKSLIQIIKNQL